jgi:hypothetical protein
MVISLADRRASLLDELVKIGKASESSDRKALKSALGTAAIAGLGIGVGTAGAGLIGHHLAKQPVTSGTLSAVKIILPILTGTAVVLGNELRKMKEEKYKKVPGWGNRKT